MIEITSFDFGVPHGIAPVGDVPGIDHGAPDIPSTNLSPAEAGAPTSALKIHVPNPNNPYDGTVFDKDLWLNAPHPDDGDKVCEWAKDMAAAQPKAACDQWSSDDWDAWTDKYAEHDCDIPKCGEDFNPQLEPMYQHNTGESYLNTLNHNAKSQLAVIPEGVERVQYAKLNNNFDSSKPAFMPSLNGEEILREPESPRRRQAILNLDKDASPPAPMPPSPTSGEEDEDSSPVMTPRSWDMMTKSRASPGHLVLSCHAMTLAIVETSIKGGSASSFKQDALANAGAVTPVGKALLETHVFAPALLPEKGCEYNFDVFYETPVEGVIYSF